MATALTTITTVLAVYGAVVSTVTAVWTWLGRRRRIDVSVDWCIPIYSAKLGSQRISINAVNHGHQTVRLKSAGFLSPDKRLAVLPEAQGTVKLPHDLDGGDSCSVWADPQILAKELAGHRFSGKVNLKGFYLDGAGKRQFSKPFEFDVEKHMV